VVEKPFTVESLGARVREILGREAAGAQRAG
jgi:DNA-binding response OmpR family regulator